MILFDGGGDDTGNANTVTTHPQDLIAAVFVEYRGIHRLAVFLAELKYMADFYAAGDCQHAIAVGALVAAKDIANIGNQRRLIETSCRA